jgi:hypothetical protein
MKMRSVCDIKFFVTGHNTQVDRIFSFGFATVGSKFGWPETDQLPCTDSSNVSGKNQDSQKYRYCKRIVELATPSFFILAGHKML